MQIFMLHFAGGNSFSYEFLRKEISEYFDFIPLELPGRGKRSDEPLVYRKDAAVKDYVTQIKKRRNGQPYIIFGHSMGATLGLLVAKELENQQDAPHLLMVSGNAGPNIKREDTDGVPRYLLSDAEMKDFLRKLGGVPQQVLDNKDLFNYFNPILRADFEVIEKDSFDIKDKLQVTPILAMMGSNEERSDKIDNWGKYTNEDFQSTIMNGNHFFIYKNVSKIINLIETAASQAV